MEKANDAGILVVPATGRVRNFIPPCHRAAVYPLRHHLKRRQPWDILENRLCTDLIPTETALEVQNFDDYELCNGILRARARRYKARQPDKARTIFTAFRKKNITSSKDYTFADNLSAYLKETHAEPEKINMMFIPESVRRNFGPPAKVRRHRAYVLETSITSRSIKRAAIRAPHCIRSARSSASIQKHHGGGAITATTSACRKAAGFAAVVGNGIEEAKAIADAVVAPCIEDGFAEAVERFALR